MTYQSSCPSDLIIVEGILVFHDKRIHNLMDMKKFVDTEDDLRLVRRINHDAVDRGKDVNSVHVNSVLEQYGRFVKPAFDEFILPSKKYADIIELGEGFVYEGVGFDKMICGVSINRSGENMENALRECCDGIRIAKFFIQLDRDIGDKVLYGKLPNDIHGRYVLLLNPILDTGVSGGTASGKTTVCNTIIQKLHDHRVVLINQDLSDNEAKHVQDYNFDHPDAFDDEELLRCITELRRGKSFNIPIYDFKNNSRHHQDFRKVNPSDVIIVEGILVFHDERVRNLMNMKIFVDTGVSGGTAFGKTTVCNTIIQKLHDHRVVLINQVNPSDVIIVEGILVFHDERVCNLMDMKIFVDTDDDLRLVRRIKRDAVDRDRDVNSVLVLEQDSCALVGADNIYHWSAALLYNLLICYMV